MLSFEITSKGDLDKSDNLERAKKKALPVIAEFVKGKSKDLCPVKTGHLKDSIKSEVKGDIAFLGTDVNYACIFGAGAHITTKKASKRIGKIKIGDMVLTQTGEYKKVVNINKFRAIRKPRLINIEVEWRKGKSHKLIVTEDHKILINRENRNKWVMAKDMLLTDKIYSRKKIAYNKKYKVCEYCQKERKARNKKYCSIECRTMAWKIKNPHTGMKRTQVSKLKMRKARQKYHVQYPEKHINRILAQKGYRTKHEKDVQAWLDLRNIKYKTQFQIGKRYVDFFIPKNNEVFEADGAYWHSNQQIDIQRDRELLNINNKLKITHIHFYDKRFTNIFDANPLPNVHYIVCNPDIKSFVDKNVFEQKKIVSLTKWTYKNKKHKNDGLGTNLYDLSVEDIHSFYANGMLVSNSYVEYGTSRQSPQSFLRKAIDMHKKEILEIFSQKIIKAWK